MKSFVIAGLGGAGKSVLAQSLAVRARERSMTTIVAESKRNTLLETMLATAPDGNRDVALRHLGADAFYAVNILEALADIAEKRGSLAFATDVLLIEPRSNLERLAAARVSGVSHELLRSLESLVFSNLGPGILLDVAPEEATERVVARNASQPEYSVPQLKRIRDELRAYADRCQFPIIDGSHEPEVVADAAWRILSSQVELQT